MPDERYTHGYSENTTQIRMSRTAERQGAFFLPHLRSGMSLLDCGCGPGSITEGLAKIVAPGQVVGIDFDQGQIDLARAYAIENGTDNVRFETGNVYELPFEDSSLDAVFAHALLEHLGEPARLFEEVHRVLKPGGVIGVRSPDWSGKLFYPDDPMLVAGIDLYHKLWIENGGDPYIGKKLGSLLVETGFERIEVSATFDCFGPRKEEEGSLPQVYAGRLSEPSNREKVIGAGLIDSDSIEKILVSLRSWGTDSGTFYGWPECQVVGWKQ